MPRAASPSKRIQKTPDVSVRSTPTPQAVGERAYEASLRPQTLEEFVGQAGVKKHLRVFLAAAKKRKEALEHVLFSGPAGLGKTTLATIVAGELGTNLRVTSGGAIEKTGDLAAILTNLEEGDLLFVDEIHRLPRVVEEVLYSAMEDFFLDVVLGQGPGAKTVRLTISRFTLIGATTRVGMLSAPFRDRFGVTHRLTFYTEEEIVTILRRSSRLLRVDLDDEAAARLAQSSRGTPRVANRLLKRARDLAEVEEGRRITVELAGRSLALLEVDARGLDAVDRTLLTTVIDVFGGGPVGLTTLAAATHEDEETLEGVTEPYLLQLGFLQRTPRGRVATPAAYVHLGRPLPAEKHPQLL
ncbi:MAG: holliday junction DNA helicase RuvB [Parcubacteria group bacterium Gr01-1014_38]|nr:MAG: holliday junction DNA helicase RuvB [Parcubacteria group bacterium Gr01-1014_38]